MEQHAWHVRVKVCSECGVEKATSEFHPHANTKDRLRAKCRQCTGIENKRWAEFNKLKIKDAYYKRTYGISYDEVLSKHEELGHKCEVCFEEQGLLDVDHCHSSGKVRGFLCSRCNLLLGKIEGNKELINKLYAYLDERG